MLEYWSIVEDPGCFGGVLGAKAEKDLISVLRSSLLFASFVVKKDSHTPKFHAEHPHEFDSFTGVAPKLMSILKAEKPVGIFVASHLTGPPCSETKKSWFKNSSKKYRLP